MQRWRTEASPEPSSRAAASLVARRALRVTGELPDVRGAVVLRFTTPTQRRRRPRAVGPSRCGQVLTDGRQVDVLPDSRISDLLALAPTAPLVALVREPHRHAWVPELLLSLAEARPDLVVVEMGWPGDALPPGVTTVHTYGAAAANARALDELLARGTAADDLARR